MSTTYGRPGVTVTEVLAPRDTGFVSSGASRSVLLADVDRGPLEATTVASWNEFRQVYGDWSENAPRTIGSYVHTRNASVDAAFLYFANATVGGSPLTVLRVCNSDAVKATGDLKQASVVVLKVTAASPGEWGNRVRVRTTGQWGASGSFDPDGFTPIDFNTPDAGSGGNLELTVELLDRYGVYQVMERFTNLSLDSADRRFVEYVVNGSSTQIRVETGTAVTTGTANAEVVLTSGASGTTAPSLSTILHQLDFYDNALTISYSGHWDTTSLIDVTTYCRERGDSFHVIDTPDLGSGLTEVTNWVDSLGSSAFSAVYYPPVIMNDPASGPNNLRRVTPNGGAVLGAFASNDANYGMWKTPAGVTSGIKGIISPAYKFTNPQLDQMNNLIRPINPIRVVNGVGPCIMGGRTMDQAQADRYVGVRRSFSYLRARLSALTEFAVFEVNGPNLWDTIEVRLSNFLGLYYQQGALRGARESEAFYVKCDSTNNTRNTIAAGEVHVEVGVAIEYPAEFIVIKLTHNQTSVRID
jgi:hypothetical protein